MSSGAWKVGSATIKRVIEVDAGSIIQSIIPEATRENILAIPWLRPHFSDNAGSLKAVVQSFIIEVDGQKVLVDSCVGNGKSRKEMAAWNGLNTDFLGKLASLGCGREDVDIVLCTHLHFDHVGWNSIKEKGRWVPTFPNARYLFCKEEFDYWKGKPAAEIEDDHAGFADSVLPVFDVGLVDLVKPGHRIAGGLSLVPTPGHTPGHASVLLESEGEQALITGDAIHHPCQIARPEWGTISDTNKELARNSRRSILNRFVDSETLLVGSHFASPTAGLLQRDSSSFRLITRP